MKKLNHLKRFDESSKSKILESIYIPLGRNISGSWDDGYDFEGTLDELESFIYDIIDSLDNDEKNHIISNIINKYKK
jgi:hypothetical protein